MDKPELWKLRAEDFARNFESLRGVEWRIVFQLYAGYAAVALAFHLLSEKYHGNSVLIAAAVTAYTILFVTALYLSLRIQERLHSIRYNANKYLDELHLILNERPAHLTPDEKWPESPCDFQKSQPRVTLLKWFRTNDRPIHKKWYAFGAQTVISAAIYLGLVLYAFCATPGTEPPKGLQSSIAGPGSLPDITQAVEVEIRELEKLKKVMERVEITTP